MLLNYNSFLKLRLLEGWMGEIWKRGLSEEEVELYDNFNKSLNIFYKKDLYRENFKYNFKILIPANISDSGKDEEGEYYFTSYKNRTILPDLHTINSNQIEIWKGDKNIGLLNITNGNYIAIDKKEKLMEEFFNKIKNNPKKAIYMKLEGIGINFDNKEDMEKIDKFDGQWRFLSNFSPSKINYEGIEYPTLEHAFQASKTLDVSLREKFAELKTPGESKKLGRKVKLRADWESVKNSIMYDLVKIKFQNPELKKKLLSTGNKILIEGNDWGDTYWGVSGGKGKNKLGKILMQVREELKSE